MGMRGGGKAGRFCTIPMRIATEDACVRMYVLVTQSYLTLCEPLECSRPGSSVHGIL